MPTVSLKLRSLSLSPSGASSFALSGVLAGLVALGGCGGAPPPPVVVTPLPVPLAPPGTVATAAPAAPAPPDTSSFPASDEEDPEESATPIAMAPEISLPFDLSSFPAKTADEGKCWQTIQVTGSAQRDFDSVVASCGAPTGLREYVKPGHGHLHSVKDKRDTFSIHLAKGLCYRFFAVGDSGIKDIDILVEKNGNVLVGDDKQTGPVAIIDADKTWCMTSDVNYFFNIEVDGDGQGRYVFGAWARPAGKNGK